MLALTQRNCNAFRQFLQTFFHHAGKRHARLVIDDLYHPHQAIVARFQNGRDQHLLGSVAGTLIYFLQKTQMRTDPRQFLGIVHILDIQHLFIDRNITSHALLGNGQLQILEGFQPGLDFGHQRSIIFADHVNGQSLRIEQGANILADFQNDFIHIAGSVHLVGDMVQVLVEFKYQIHIPWLCCFCRTHVPKSESETDGLTART